MTRPKVAITILSYQSAGHVASCVESVLAQTSSGVELAVVDNASADGSADVVRERFPDVQVFRNKRNLGFARAHNPMIAQTRAKYYMPLNADCRLAPEFVERLVRAIEEERAGYGTGKVVFSDTPPPYATLRSSASSLRSSATAEDGCYSAKHESLRSTSRIYSTGHTLLRDGTVRNRGYGEEDSGAYDRRETVWGANGAAPIYSMRMLRKLSLSPREFFDETFFMYGEDADMDWRAHGRGLRCVYEPGAVAYHAGEGSEGLRARRVRRQYVRNAQIVKIMNAPLGRLARCMLPVIASECFRYGLGDPLGAAFNAAETIILLPKVLMRRRGRNTARAGSL